MITNQSLKEANRQKPIAASIFRGVQVLQIIVKICIFALMDDINEIFNLTDKQPQPQAGSLLVAKPTVDDLCFKRSVIMMIDISSHSSMGLMVNYEAGDLLH